MRRHPEYPGDLIDLELPCFQELGLLRRYGYRRIFHAFFQNGNLVRITASAESCLPALPDSCRIFDRTGMLQHTGRCRTVRKELAAVFFRSYRKPYGVLCHSNRRISHKPVKAKPRDMQHIRRMKDHKGLIIFRKLIL